MPSMDVGMKQLPVFERENAGRQKACKSLTASQPRRPGFPKTEFVTPVPQGGGKGADSRPRPLVLRA